jgi:hypothetical protein
MARGNSLSVCPSRVLARVATWYVFHTENPNLGLVLEGLAMKNVGIFCSHFGPLYGHLVYFIFLRFGKLYQEKSLNHGIFMAI